MDQKGDKKIWFISRHPGAWEWFEESGNRGRWQVTHRAPHLDPAEVSPGDIVLGTLPIHIAEKICRRGAEYWHLSLDLAEHNRGAELSREDMVKARGRLEHYDIRRVDK